VYGGSGRDFDRRWELGELRALSGVALTEAMLMGSGIRDGDREVEVGMSFDLDGLKRRLLEGSRRQIARGQQFGS